MLLAVSIALLTLFINLAITHRMRLIGVALLLIPLLYVPGLPVTLAVLWTLITCLAGWTARGRPRANSPLIVIMGLFVAVTAVSLLWALPSGMSAGVATVFRGALFLLWLREVIALAKEDPELLDTIVLWTVPGVAVQSVLAIVFQVSPAIEEQFLRSELAIVTIGPGVEHLYADMANNVLEPSKSGGFYVNGNMASLLGGIAALLLLVAARRTSRRWLYVFAALSFAGSIFTGSKTALIVATCCAIATLFLPHMLKGWAVLVGLPLVLLVPLTFSAMTEFLGRIAPTFYDASDSSFSGRARLWESAAQLFAESPFFGIGFGGWAEQVSRFPPHNFLIAAWAVSGIVAAVVAIVFMVVAIAIGLRVAAAQPTVRDRRTAVFVLCAIAWVFIHGMADNTTLYGEQRSMFLVALAFGYLYAMMRCAEEESVGSDNDDNLAGTSVPSSSAHADQ